MSDHADDAAIQVSAQAVRTGLRELAANLMRVARGDGRPDLILAQTIAFVEFVDAHRIASGKEPTAEDITEALRFENIPDDEDEIWPDWDRAVREIVNGALQVAAAELLVQNSQAAAGRRELFAGYRHIEKLHRKQLHRLLARRAGDNEN